MLKTGIDILIGNQYDLRLIDLFTTHLESTLVTKSFCDDYKYLIEKEMSRLKHIVSSKEKESAGKKEFKPLYVCDLSVIAVEEFLNFLVDGGWYATDANGKEFYEDVLNHLKCKTKEEAFEKLEKIFNTPSLYVVYTLLGEEDWEKYRVDEFICDSYKDAEKAKAYLISTHPTKEEARKEIEERTGLSEDFCNEVFKNISNKALSKIDRIVYTADSEYTNIRYNYEDELDVHIEEVKRWREL